MTLKTTDQQLPGQAAWVAVIGMGMLAMLLFASLLVSLRLEKALTELLEDRAELMARQLAGAIEGGLRFGVPLADQAETPRKMAALSELDPELRALALFDDKAGVVFHQAATGNKEAPDTRTVQRLLLLKGSATSEAPKKVWTDALGIQVLMQVRDATGAVSGAVWAVYSAQAPQAAYADSLRQLGLWALVLATTVTALAAAVLGVMGRRSLHALDNLQNPGADPMPPWPVLPVPQALTALTQLERELEAELSAVGQAPKGSTAS